jgi:hypothetical protein
MTNEPRPTPKRDVEPRANGRWVVGYQRRGRPLSKHPTATDGASVRAGAEPRANAWARQVHPSSRCPPSA